VLDSGHSQFQCSNLTARHLDFDIAPARRLLIREEGFIMIGYDVTGFRSEQLLEGDAIYRLIRIIVTVYRWISKTGGRSTGNDLQ
jgi:hypothetical protein